MAFQDTLGTTTPLFTWRKCIYIHGVPHVRLLNLIVPLLYFDIALKCVHSAFVQDYNKKKYVSVVQ